MLKPKATSNQKESLSTNIISLVLRVIISFVLIGFIVLKLDLSVLNDKLSGHGLLLLLPLIFNFLGILISSLRWQVLLVSGQSGGLRRLFFLYLLGKFANAFLPTSIGGDIVRVYSLSDDRQKRMESFGSVFMDRATGLIALAAIAGISLILVPKDYNIEVYMAISMLVGLSAVFTALLISDRFHRYFLMMVDSIKLKRIRSFLIRASLTIFEYEKRKRAVWIAILWSFLFQFTVILQCLVVAWILDIKIPAIYFFIFMPIINVLTMVPISINGLGVREAGFIYFFTSVSVSATDAVSISLLVSILSTMVSLLGGLAYLLNLFNKSLLERDRRVSHS